jgi:hypothetical protein
LVREKDVEEKGDRVCFGEAIPRQPAKDLKVDAREKWGVLDDCFTKETGMSHHQVFENPLIEICNRWAKYVKKVDHNCLNIAESRWMTEERLDHIRNEFHVSLGYDGEEERLRQGDVFRGRIESEYRGDAGMAEDMKLADPHPRIRSEADCNEFCWMAHKKIDRLFDHLLMARMQSVQRAARALRNRV